MHKERVQLKQNGKPVSIVIVEIFFVSEMLLLFDEKYSMEMMRCSIDMVSDLVTN